MLKIQPKVFLKYAICVTLAESGEWVMLAEW